MIVLLLLAASSLLTGVAANPPEARRLLIEPGELQKALQQPELRILDTRTPADYSKGHIPGSVWVDVKSWQDLAKKPGGLHDAKAWGAKVGQLGIGPRSSVVVYGSNPADAARIWWTLKYLGLPNVALLDGGWQGWIKEKRPTDTASPRTEAGTFEPKFQADRLAEIEALKESVRSGKVTILDTRSQDEFTGKEVRGKVGGHVPGARHLEWKDLLTLEGRFKSPEQLRDLFRQRGIAVDDAAVCYCQSGGRASVEAFALELAGYPKVKLFLRGWEQWSADPAAPVEKP